MKRQNTTPNKTKKQSLKGRFDLAKIEATTEEDIERHAREDDDAWTDEMFAKAHILRPRKEGIHIMVDPRVLAFFRREGRGYQSRINAALEAYVDAHERKAK